MSIITAEITSGGATYTFDETQIIINPTISKSICSGGYSAGNTACACLKIGVPYNIFYNKGDLVKVFYGSNQIMGNYYIDSFEKCGYAKINPSDTYLTQMVMLTCYDSMSKLDDYPSFSTETVTIPDICSKITESTGLNFATNSAMGSSFEMPKADAESKTMREWLGVFGAYQGGNYIIHPYWLNNAYVEEITFIPIDYSGASFTAIENTKITVENDITFSKVICKASETFKSGDDTGETLSIDCQYATQDSTDIIQYNIEGEYYTAFKCDKAIINFVSVDIGDTFIPKNATTGYKMYSLDLVISIKGLYLTCGADVFKKKINDEPQIKKSDELKAITEFAVTFENGIATFTWKNPTSNFTGAILKRKATTDFNNIFEGETIYTGNAETFADTLPNDYTTYYYRILSYYGDNYNADCDGLSVEATDTPPPSKSYMLHGTNTILDECVTHTMGWIKYSTSHYPKNPYGYCFPAFSPGYVYIAENDESVQYMLISAYGGSSPTAESYIETYRGMISNSQTITIDFYNLITNYNNISVYFRVYSRVYQDLTAPLTLISEKSNLTNPELFTTTGIKKITLNTNTSGRLVEFVVRIGCTATNSSRASVNVINVYYGG